MVAFTFSSKPADENHRFGHEKIEDLAVFVQSSFFGVSGFFVLINGLLGIFKPKITHPAVGIKIIFLTIIVTTILTLVQTYVYKRTKSSLVAADRLHYSVDLLTNVGVIVSLYLSSHYDLPFIDSLFSILLALLMIKSAYYLISKAFANLVDSEFDDAKKEVIVNIVKTYPEVLGMHDIKTRQAGSKLFIQFHLEFDGEIKLKHSHEITENIVKELQVTFPGAEIILHQDPYGIDEDIEYPFEYNSEK
jgi:ferrous-iron efflux pump FieF